MVESMLFPDSPILRLAWLKRLSGGGGGERRVNIDPHLALPGGYITQNTNTPPFAQFVTNDGVATTVYYIDDSGDGRFARDANKVFPEHLFPLMMPKWSEKLIVTVPDQRIKVTVQWTNTEESGGWSDSFIRSVYFVEPWDSTVPAGNREISRPNDGENSFYVNLYCNPSVLVLTQEIIDQVTVVAVREA